MRTGRPARRRGGLRASGLGRASAAHARCGALRCPTCGSSGGSRSPRGSPVTAARSGTASPECARDRARGSRSASSRSTSSGDRRTSQSASRSRRCPRSSWRACGIWQPERSCSSGAWRDGARPTRHHWREALLLGAVFFLGGNGAVVWAEQRIPSGIASLLIATMPLWVVVLDWLRPGGAPAASAGRCGRGARLRWTVAADVERGRFDPHRHGRAPSS